MKEKMRVIKLRHKAQHIIHVLGHSTLKNSYINSIDIVSDILEFYMEDVAVKFVLHVDELDGFCTEARNEMRKEYVDKFRKWKEVLL